jgi:4,5-dihydroxyphthalate decarboxylase
MALKLTFGCALYDQFAPLLARRVQPEGIDLTFLVEEDHRSTFDRMGATQEFDVAEMSGTELVTRHAAGGSPLIALPVFTSRVFRHSFLFVNRRSGIRTPKDLEGKHIGVPLYTMSAGLWLRGMLADEYGVDFATVRWLQGAVESAGTHGAPTLPPGIKVSRLEQNTSGRSLWELLVAGEIDALMTPSVPHAFGSTDAVGRLFEDFAGEEQRYYRKTGIFPIMHMIALRRDRYEEHPFIARSLFDAFERSKALARETLYETGAPRAMLPFLPAYIEETQRVFNGDPWVYGIEPNRRTLEAQQSYLHREGLIAKRFPIEELFALP